MDILCLYLFSLWILLLNWVLKLPNSGMFRNMKNAMNGTILMKLKDFLLVFLSKFFGRKVTCYFLFLHEKVEWTVQLKAFLVYPPWRSSTLLKLCHLYKLRKFILETYVFFFSYVIIFLCQFNFIWLKPFSFLE